MAGVPGHGYASSLPNVWKQAADTGARAVLQKDVGMIRVSKHGNEDDRNAAAAKVPRSRHSGRVIIHATSATSHVKSTPQQYHSQGKWLGLKIL